MMPVCSAIGGINFDHLVKVAACFFINLFTHSDFHRSFNCTIQSF